MRTLFVCVGSLLALVSLGCSESSAPPDGLQVDLITNPPVVAADRWVSIVGALENWGSAATEIWVSCCLYEPRIQIFDPDGIQIYGQQTCRCLDQPESINPASRRVHRVLFPTQTQAETPPKPGQYLVIAGVKPVSGPEGTTPQPVIEIKTYFRVLDP